MKPISLGLAACLFLTACSGAETPPEQQAVPVRAVTVASQAVPNVIELPGRVEPVRVAEVRARVTGIVQQRLYEEGSDVGAGQPLFRIDPRELRASYAQTQAALQRAQGDFGTELKNQKRNSKGMKKQKTVYILLVF